MQIPFCQGPAPGQNYIPKFDKARSGRYIYSLLCMNLTKYWLLWVEQMETAIFLDSRYWIMRGQGKKSSLIGQNKIIQQMR